MNLNNANVLFGSQYGILKTSEFRNDRSYIDSNIIIFCIHLPDYVPFINDLSTYLETSEKKRALNYFKEKDKNRFIICRSLLKFVLAYHVQSDVNDIFIEILPNKKPYVSTHPNVNFNVSHSGDYAVMALSSTPVGIDLEYINPNYSHLETLQYIFNENEIHFINNSDNKIKTFFSLWTRKESLVKALGIGINDDFKNMPCLDGLHSLNSRFNLPFKAHWEAIDFQVESNYQGSIVFANQDKEHRNIKSFHFPTDLSKLLKF